MPVQRMICAWPTCFAETGLVALVGLTGEWWPHCGFHHDWVLRDMAEHRTGLLPMPVTERTQAVTPQSLKSHPFQVWCDKEPCTFRVVEKTMEAGERALSVHQCPYVGSGVTRVSPYVSMNGVIEAWTALDSAVAELLEGNWPDQSDGSPHPERVRLKGVCRGMAELLAIFMRPHFETADQISAEAAKRYKAKKAGEEYNTPGLTPQTFGQPRTREWKEDINKKPGQKTSSAPAAAPAHKFTADEIESIKFAAESGMFTHAQLAKTYGVKESVIKEVVGSA